MTRRRLIAPAGAALVLALATPPAHAASTTPVAVAEGAARWTTGGTVARDLARAGATLRAGTVSQKQGRRLDLRVTGGTTRTLEHGFGTAFVLRKGRYTVRVSELRVRLGAKGRVTGRLDDGGARTLFTLGRAELRRGDGIAASRSLRPRLTATAARELRKRLHVRTLRAGSYGTLRIAVSERPRVPVRRPSTSTTTTETTTTTSTPPAPAIAPGGAAAGCPAPAAAPAGTPAVSGGTLEWGFKSTFRSYVRSGAAHGSISVSGGVTETADRFVFGAPQGVLRADGTGDARYAGTVYFEGHGTGDGALLRLWICRPRVVLTSATAGVLRADIASRTLEGEAIVAYPDVALADLDLTGTTPTVSGGARTWTGVPTTLRSEGAGAFAGFYQAGQALDPITFRLVAPTS